LRFEPTIRLIATSQRILEAVTDNVARGVLRETSYSDFQKQLRSRECRHDSYSVRRLGISKSSASDCF